MNKLAWRVDKLAAIGLTFAVAHAVWSSFNSFPITLLTIVLLMAVGLTEALLFWLASEPTTSNVNPRSFCAIGCAMVGSYSLSSDPIKLSQQTYFVVGTLMLFFSLYILWAFITLGKHISLFPAYKGVVSNGPYAYIRHPVYTSHLNLAACILICFPTVSNSAAFMLMLAGLVWRAHLEERHLRSHEDYVAYAENTRWAMISIPLSSPLLILVATRLIYDS